MAGAARVSAAVFRWGDVFGAGVRPGAHIDFLKWRRGVLSGHPAVAAVAGRRTESFMKREGRYLKRGIAIERDRYFYGSVLSLAVPLALQSALMYSVTTLNSIMLGALGEVPMSASAIADQPFLIVSGILRGLTPVSYTHLTLPTTERV